MTLTEKITKAVHKYLSSFEKKDLDGIMSIYAEDCWIEDPVGSERKVGREALREFYALGVDMGVRMTLESEIRIAGNEAAFAFRLEADTPEGRLSVRPIDVMVFDDEGKVRSMRAYFGPTNQGLES
ncbi:MAG: nuclear transport factor 2 family protein [Spirochaetaceae bacterium]|nr:nuclear transport factor 2 family protein [Spirochaetaceae bacterium]HPG24804.1 nuclear transport factor 2 family protein [Myxococcota bacterium]